ncbi:SRPBCC domain-containing protein [Streptomyces sp. ISL-21]|uniref:SRPBCC domain-containing protein n=1 Tax=Streptomyces sp. ISL-21 TaxID=2819179 RepID=UPI001BE7ACB3|nr:SRPBCC domain-containing protein [Streptomyces sp. ISL-21]MBT2402119.1 SRPBCC family protein [Streptomyces sp. ISL-21]
MEHQAFVPVPADDIRAVLRDPARVARCVPGLQQDADTESGPVSGRLKVRVGGHTVTYRGALAVTERDPDRFAVTGEGTEIRGSGTVTLSLMLRLTPEGDGTRLHFTAEATADGRAAAFPPEATLTTVHRLLDRTATHLAAAATEPETPPIPGPAPEPTADSAPKPVPKPAPEPPQEPVLGSVSKPEPKPEPKAEPKAEPKPEQEPTAEPERKAEPKAEQEPTAEPGPDAAQESSQEPTPEALADPVAEAEEAAEGDDDDEGEAGDGDEVTASVFEAEVPPPSLDPFLDGDLGELGDSSQPPAEAAHARRTMIGRSAEEVDHAPPRGRYAPVPAPSSATVGQNLRWLAPAAALAVASAVVIGRALRRRR